MTIARSSVSMQWNPDLDTSTLHDEEVLHLIALIVDDRLGRVLLLSHHMSQAFNCANWQTLELRHLCSIKL